MLTNLLYHFGIEALAALMRCFVFICHPDCVRLLNLSDCNSHFVGMKCVTIELDYYYWHSKWRSRCQCVVWICQ